MIAKGILNKERDQGRIEVFHCGKRFELEGRDAMTWKAGYHNPVDIDAPFSKLLQKSLIEVTDERASIPAKYWLLSRCIICSVRGRKKQHKLSEDAKYFLRWLKRAPLHLTIAELVRIAELGLYPTKHYTSVSKRQALVEAIYAIDSIKDNILEAQMRYSAQLPRVVAAIYELLQNKHIYLS